MLYFKYQNTFFTPKSNTTVLILNATNFILNSLYNLSCVTRTMHVLNYFILYKIKKINKTKNKIQQKTVPKQQHIKNMFQTKKTKKI
jgi:hypothetical protein